MSGLLILPPGSDWGTSTPKSGFENNREWTPIPNCAWTRPNCTLGNLKRDFCVRNVDHPENQGGWIITAFKTNNNSYFIEMLEKVVLNEDLNLRLHAHREFTIKYTHSK